MSLHNTSNIKKTYARILFLDYSCAFNTIIPGLHNKLTQLSISTICQCCSNFLTGRAQQVSLGKLTSGTWITNTGALQGCVLSPLLFLYTNVCTSTDLYVEIIKFADDTSTSLLTHGWSTSGPLEQTQQA